MRYRADRARWIVLGIIGGERSRENGNGRANQFHGVEQLTHAQPVRHGLAVDHDFVTIEYIQVDVQVNAIDPAGEG